MKHITFITGGARSGKSRHALVRSAQSRSKVFIATAENIDGEMQTRIARHQAERSDDYLTIEEPVYLENALRRIPQDTEVAVIDCLTVWLGNLFHYFENPDAQHEEVSAFLQAMKHPPCDLILVSNELGMGLVPETPMGRRFRDTAGIINQQIAEIADTVIFMVSGIPLATKEKQP